MTLAKGIDFDVAYSNNVQPGTATVTITGKGNYTGTREVNFIITAPPAPAAPVITAVKASSKATVTAAPGTTTQIDTGAKAGTKFKSSNKKVASVSNGVLIFPCTKAGKG